MTSRLPLLILALAVGLCALPAQQAAAQDTLRVAWGDIGGVPIPNALRDAIANDTLRPDGRVYLLERGGFYWNEDRIQYDGFHLRIVGETAEMADPSVSFVCGDNFDEDCGPAIIQRVRREDQSIDGVMIQNSGDGSDLTLKNLWLMGQDNDGVTTSYEQIQLDAVNARYTIDNVIFDRNDWHFLGPNGENVDMFVTNSIFRNNHGPSQQWEGLGVRFEVGADSVVFENNTFLNIGFTPFQSEAAPMEYFLVNHNTFVNIGRSFQAGALWKEAYVANNVFVNPFWHGEMPSEYNDPDREDPFTGFFGISALPARFGTDFDRAVVLANNSYWRDPAFAEAYGDTIRMQPIVNDTTAGWFDAFDNMVMTGNYIDERPNLNTYPDLIDEMVENITQIRMGNSDSPLYRWDPGRDEECFVCNVWPLPEDFSYTNATLQDGGTDGLALGDLNWFPDDKADYLANRDAYVMDIQEMAGERVELESVALIEGELGALDGDAAVDVVGGFKSFFMQGSGSITWTFDIEQAGTYGLNVNTNLRSETQRGQHIRVDGVGLRNNESFGEYYFCNATIDGCANPLPNNEWVTVEIRAAGLIAGAEALTLEAGEHTIEIAPSWGWQGFSNVDIVDEVGNVVLSLDPVAANAVGVEAICEESTYCPQGFTSVAVGAGGSVSWTIDAPLSGDYIMRVFYQAVDGGANAQLMANGDVVLPSVTIAQSDTTGGDFFTDSFTLDQGQNTLTLMSSQGTFRVDYIQVLSLGGTVANERSELPDGYALDQNYPNPFNPTTTINFTLGDPGTVRLSVFDVMGRKVAELVDGQYPAGTHRVQWNGLGADGLRAASGVYLYRLETPVGQQVRTMVLMK